MSQRWTGGLIAGLIVVGAVGYVGFSLARPEPPTFAPSPIEARPVSGALVGPVTYTVDARASDRWVYFSFAHGSVVPEPRPFEWDLAFRRFQVIVNGGDAFPGMGGVLALGEVPFHAIGTLPEEGYVGTEVIRGDSVATPLGEWYRYSFLSHLLSPGEGVYGIRTADGRYAKLRFEGYYCVGALPGCITFEYVYQGGGGREVGSPDRDPGSMEGGEGAED
jgi:hypothetical protein